jgi:hypothetical protein
MVHNRTQRLDNLRLAARHEAAIRAIRACHFVRAAYVCARRRAVVEGRHGAGVASGEGRGRGEGGGEQEGYCSRDECEECWQVGDTGEGSGERGEGAVLSVVIIGHSFTLGGL